MCDECRETLASRSSAGKHRCPCCRRRYVFYFLDGVCLGADVLDWGSVEGYSRIFIP
jgi:hypothetical protein